MKQASIIRSFSLYLPFVTIIGLHPGSAGKELTRETPPVNTILTGKVVDASNNKPLRNSHVYVVHGEEEDLTNDKGEFSITTWQKFPLTLSAEHAGYEKFKITISRKQQIPEIKLRPKAMD